MSFDIIFDLTAGVYFYFYSIDYINLLLLIAKARRGEKTHSVEEAQRGVTAK